MSYSDSRKPVARRSFLSRFGAGAAAFGAAFAAGEKPGFAQTAGTPARWQPARHAEDDWLEEGAAKHRFFFDTTDATTLGHALTFANNYGNANRGEVYGLKDEDFSVVICLRHESTGFAFSNAMWAKYGQTMSERAKVVDPKTKQPAMVNLYQATGYNDMLANRGTTLDSLIGHGTRFAVCAVATRGLATQIARVTGGKVEDVVKELTDNRIPNSRMVAAGIVAVNRAQERGYSISSVT